MGKQARDDVNKSSQQHTAELGLMVHQWNPARKTRTVCDGRVGHVLTRRTCGGRMNGVVLEPPHVSEVRAPVHATRSDPRAARTAETAVAHLAGPWRPMRYGSQGEGARRGLSAGRLRLLWP